MASWKWINANLWHFSLSKVKTRILYLCNHMDSGRFPHKPTLSYYFDIIYLLNYLSHVDIIFVVEPQQSSPKVHENTSSLCICWPLKKWREKTTVHMETSCPWNVCTSSLENLFYVFLLKNYGKWNKCHEMIRPIFWERTMLIFIHHGKYILFFKGA